MHWCHINISKNDLVKILYRIIQQLSFVNLVLYVVRTIVINVSLKIHAEIDLRLVDV